ncbi:MAG: PKD domain-containing protein, partial [Flavobacteriales bacterium]
YDDSPNELYQLTNHSQTDGGGFIAFSQGSGSLIPAKTRYLSANTPDYYLYEFGATCAGNVVIISGYGLNQTDGSTSGTFPFSFRYEKDFTQTVDNFQSKYAYPVQSTNYTPNTSIFDTYQTGGQPRIYYPKLFGQLAVNEIALAAFEDNGPESENYLVHPYFNGKDSCAWVDPQFAAIPINITEWPSNHQLTTYVITPGVYSQTPTTTLVQQCNNCSVDVSFTTTPGTTGCAYTFTANNPGLCPSFTITDVSNNVLYSGPGSTVTFPFGINGTYTVCYSDCAVGGVGVDCRDEECQTINVVCPPPCPLDADFSFTVNGCCVNFVDLTPEGNPNGCESWVFGNVSSVLAGDVTSFCFPGSGTYTVCHYDCCIDANGTVTYHQVCKQVTVSCTPPCCLPTGINVSSSNCCVTASAILPGGPCSSLFYVWSFGDGNIATGPNVTHCYTGSGIYTVCLTAYCSKFQKVQFCKRVKVLCAVPPPPPGGGGGNGTARFGFNYSGTSVTLNPVPIPSTVSMSARTWSFGDGLTSTADSPVHYYQAGGTYSITHTVEGVDLVTGEPFVSSYSQDITVTKSPACGCSPPSSGAFSSSPVVCQETNRIFLHLIDLDSEGDILNQWMVSDCGTADCPLSSFVPIPGAIGQQVWVDNVTTGQVYRCRRQSLTFGFVEWTEPVVVQDGNFTAALSASSTQACPGETVVLTASPAGQVNYEWDPVAPNANSVNITANITSTVEVVVDNDLNCGSRAQVTIQVAPCPGPPNDLRNNAQLISVAPFGTCNPVSGTVVNATVSSESTSSVTTGEDVWYRFVANSPGVRIVVSSPAVNVLVELQDVAGNVLAVENALASSGNELLNYYTSAMPLVSGQTYFISVRNVDSGVSSGDFTICAQRLRSTACNSGPGPYTMCSYFKAVFVGAQSYDFLFTDTGTGESFSYSSSSGITIAPVGQLIPQRSYTVSLTANYALADGAGTSELISIATPNACVISMAAHQVVELRETDRCSNGPKPLNALIAANRWICGSAYYQWRFKQTAPVMDVDYGPVFSSPPVNRFISLTQVAPIPGATYDVQIRPVFSNGSFGTWSTVPRCLQVLGTSSAITQNEQVLLSQDSPEYPQLTVYPNPSRDGMVNLSLIRMDTGQYAIEVVDQMGRIVHQEKLITETSGSLNRQLMLDLASGLYTVRVYGVDTDLHVKWVIQP